MYGSNGTTQWTYQGNEHLYTRKPAEGENLKHRMIGGEEMPAFTAQGGVRILAHRADPVKSAGFLPYVVHYPEPDLKVKKEDLREDWTQWPSALDSVLCTHGQFGAQRLDWIHQ